MYLSSPFRFSQPFSILYERKRGQKINNGTLDDPDKTHEVTTGSLSEYLNLMDVRCV